MIKKIYILLVFLFIGGSTFAQSEPKAILSKADIDNFIKNYEDIQKVLEKYNDEVSSLESDFAEGKNITAAIIKARSFPISAEFRKAISSFGLGNNGFEKCMIILHGINVVHMEEMLKSISKREGTEGIVAGFQKEINQIKSAIHANDFRLIVSHSADIMSIITGL